MTRQEVWGQFTKRRNATTVISTLLSVNRLKNRQQNVSQTLLSRIKYLPAIATDSLKEIITLPQIKDLFAPFEEEVPPVNHQRRWLNWETLVILAVLLIAGIAHGLNMFHYPYFGSDEGTYMSQAWAVVNMGKLSYYTYWYDHAPVGWLQIALWTIITGGFHTFGTAMQSGRILMLLFQLGSTFLLYMIARRTTKSIVLAVIAALLFALSPYGLYYHRCILLDNISTFWMLWTILLLCTRRLSLNRIWFSALTLSISILSKEITVFLIPILAYIVLVRAHKAHRIFAVTGWLVLVGVLLSLYPLMALLKGELFPMGTLLGGTNDHFSLIGSLQWQASRGKDAGLFDLHSAFWQSMFRDWLHGDPILITAGGVSALLSVLLMKKHRLVGLLGLVTLSLCVFLVRGGIIISFYIIPLLPLLALNFVMLLGVFVNKVRTYLEKVFLFEQGISRLIELVVIIVCLLTIVLVMPASATGYSYGYINPGNPLIFWNGKEADGQTQAALWVEKHLPVSSHIIIDQSMWNELYDNHFTYAHYYWKVFADPAIRDRLFHNDWRNFDYIITTPQMINDVDASQMQMIQSVLNHSTLVKRFDSGGWGVEIRKVNK